MARRRIALGLLAVALVCGAAAAYRLARGHPSIRVDLDRDGIEERVTLYPNSPITVSLWRGGACIWEGVPRRWQPWKLTTADVDGDGLPDIAVGVHKSTRYFPRPHNCLFIYGFDGEEVTPKWLGSSLNQTFTDFTFANLDDDHADELIAIERQLDRTYCVTIYSWRQFGFEVDRREGAWQEARFEKTNNGSVVVRADGQRLPIAR